MSNFPINPPTPLHPYIYIIISSHHPQLPSSSQLPPQTISPISPNHCNISPSHQPPTAHLPPQRKNDLPPPLLLLPRTPPNHPPLPLHPPTKLIRHPLHHTLLTQPHPLPPLRHRYRFPHILTLYILRISIMEPICILSRRCGYTMWRIMFSMR